MDGEKIKENAYESAPSNPESSNMTSPLRNEIVMDYTSQFSTLEYFESRDAMTTWVRNIGVANGMVIIVIHSDVGRVKLACECHGNYRPPNSKKKSGEVFEEYEAKKNNKRDTGTKKRKCPFLLTGKENTEGKWELKVDCGVHNHPVSVDLTGHAYIARLKKEERDLIDGMCDGQSRPKDILHKLKRTFTDNKSTMKTLYNYRMISVMRDRAGQSEMQYLMSKVMKHDYRYFYRRCERTNTVKDIFFAHPTNVKLLRAFPSVLLMDCTYKTNRYKLPLLEIVGVTSTSLTFQVACAYLEKEREDNYLWACDMLKSLMNQSCLPNVIVTDRELALMNAVEACFPNSKPLLCRWHISRNIMKNCKKMFPTKDAWNSFIRSWNDLVRAESESKFYELLRRIQSDFAEYNGAIEYVQKQWIIPYKERFASAWTNNFMHFKNSTTNRAESQHSVLKKQLGSSMGNFVTCWGKIHTMLEVSHGEIQSSFESSINYVKHRFKSNMFKELRGVVSIAGLGLILDEIKRLPQGGLDLATCDCVLRKTCGLPCGHELTEYVRDEKPIPLHMVDGFWRKLDMSESSVSVDSVIADLTAHFEDACRVVKSRFECADEAEKRLLLSRLREITNPTTTTLLTPEGPVVARGRPPAKKAKIDTSTKRDKSGFEYATSYDHSCDPIFVDVSQQSGKVPMFSKLPMTRNAVSPRTHIRQNDELRLLPGNMHEYVVNKVDVKSDGHCGFRAIAAHILNGSEESWTVVRCDLMNEITRNLRLWNAMYTEAGVMKLADQFHCFEELAPFKNWFDSTDMGPLVANHYNAVFVCLSSAQCTTYFPLTKEKPDNPRFIVLGFINENHWVKVNLREGHPLPPISLMWRKFRRDCAQGWEDAYKDRLDIYLMTRSSNIVTPLK